MPRLRLRIAISLDGYAAGPHQSRDHPLGEGGMRLHEWVFPLRAWRATHGLEGGDENESGRVLEAATAGVGATIMGRHMFGPVRGPWDAGAPWDGWWGETPPFGHPVFVLTHHARAPLALDGTTFHFVTGGADEALARAREAAGGRDVALAGGAATARQYLAAGLVDDMLLH
ncbi:dihydrofolate reductase family protein [Roseisolibacter sp. H3M3-2]|uniref:dihydrofolate reductase family protein n=1 Tax=Roseisolibacter sp. H3M3-2 TaxID=3031323 RepID=UPI0023DB1DC5|nr:dihydrofolate reductase family protein [Roseisolibacter sp. H3M3-2]MDF1505931.1 dihydrofolate reductase family protein [Roseisolibacter sp. H3M3-2]